MAETGNPLQQEEAARPENPILALFVNFLSSIKLPFLNNKSSTNDSEVPPVDASSKSEFVRVEPVAECEDKIEPVPCEVTFPVKKSFPGFKLEGDASETNPLILWQVYAVGGFFILRWAWSRWNERKGQKKSDDGTSPAS